METAAISDDTDIPGNDSAVRAVPRFTALLFALAVAVAAVWFRGTVVTDTVRFRPPVRDWTFHAFSGQGSVAVAVTGGQQAFKFGLKRFEHIPTKPPIDFAARWSNLGEETRFARGGVVFIRDAGRGTIGGVLVPCLPVTAGLATLALVRVAWWRLWTRRRRRMLNGQCPACGEGMRALAERCSNCGRPRARGGIRVGRTRGDEPARRAA